MDFGIQIEPQFGYSYDDIVAIGKTGEKAGFTRLWLSDHLFLDPDAVRTDCLEAWTTLAALAPDLETTRIGPVVSCQSYRNRALLAKIPACPHAFPRAPLHSRHTHAPQHPHAHSL